MGKQPLKSGAIYTYVRFVMDELKLSANELAVQAGIAPSTITRFMNNPDYKFTLSNTTIRKIAKASGINPAPFFKAEDFAQASLAPFTATDLYDETWGQGANPGLDDTQYDSIIILGEAEAGKWREVALEIVGLGMVPLSIRLGDIPPADCFAVRMRGRNLDKLVQEHEYILCVKFNPKHFRCVSGDVFVIERQLNEGRLIEISARVLKRSEGRWVLAHASSDPRFNEELPADDLSKPQGYKILGEANCILRTFGKDYDAGMQKKG